MSTSNTTTTSTQASAQGSIGYTPYFSLSFLPTIVTEWSSLIPLISHLASYQSDYQLIGKSALAGRLYVSFFPRLGTMNRIARLLEAGPSYLDRLSSNSEVSNNVWDVKGGSMFPCANGAASEMITRHALRRRQRSALFKMPDTSPVAFKGQNIKDDVSGVLDMNITTGGYKQKRERTPFSGGYQAANGINVGSRFRRYQTLHVIKIGRQKSTHSHGIYRIADLIIGSNLCGWLSDVLLLCLVVFLCLCGLFGTAAVLFNGILTHIVCRLFSFERPPGFLDNNENHNACMLLSNHRNSSTWFLYVGHRGVVDSLLNKTMISVPHVGRKLSHYFKAAHHVQLLAMTYVAAQKGWDGLTLLLLLISAWFLNLPYQQNQVVSRWLKTEDVSIKATSFEFTGRIPMLGAIYRMSGTRSTAWMDDIVAPTPRRTVWLNQLSEMSDEVSCLNGDFKSLSPYDQDWVDLNSGLTIRDVKILQEKLGYESWA